MPDYAVACFPHHEGHGVTYLEHLLVSYRKKRMISNTQNRVLEKEKLANGLKLALPLSAALWTLILILIF